MLEAMLGNIETSQIFKYYIDYFYSKNNIIFWSIFFPEKKSPQEQMTSWDRWKYCSPLLKGVSQSLGQSASQSVNQSVSRLIDDQRTTTPTSFCDTRSAVRIVD
ncbi:hypothetical protein T02_3137 [Trichinella nativa]|uniref:Uncharacterized protein n=1 Tax=Trichinella nativa TaxID=6335 RepID=A0A0V1KYX4_9BILA|nr:hypothetical protein T02_3137 [Trichinella nativa]